MAEGRSSDRGAQAPLMVAPPGERTRGGTLPGDLLFSAAVVALFGLLVARVVPQLLEGALLDTDSYMRLVRAGRLAETWDWFDSTIPRSNWPFGETLHWTRPVDVLLLLGASALAPFLGFGQALHLAGVFLSPLLLLATCFAMAWAVAPLVGRRLRYYAMIAVLAQVGIMGYALPGRADHHMLILLTTVLLTGAVVRLFMGAGEAGAGVATGVLAGAGVWISTEFVAALAVLLVATGLAWAVRGGDLARRCLWLSVGLLGAVTVAVLLEQPIGRLLAVEYDRVSVVHVWVAAVATIFWATVVRLDPDGRRLEPGQRGAMAVVGAAAAMGATWLAFPGFFGGPMADVDPELERLWLANLTEFQPFLVPRSVTDVGRVVAYLGPTLAATPFLIWRLARNRASSRWPVWLYLLTGIALFVPLAIRWVRFVPYAEALGVVGLMALLAALLNRIDRRLSGWRRTAARVATSTSARDR